MEETVDLEYSYWSQYWYPPWIRKESSILVDSDPRPILQVHLEEGQTLVDPDGRKGGLGIFLQVPVLVQTVDQEGIIHSGGLRSQMDPPGLP